MKKIIIIDDDPAIQDAFALIFPEKDFQITVYADATPLINNAFAIPDLFILDKQLSGIDGLDLCRLIKERPATKHIPVIILSASPNLNFLAKQAGADESLEKPFRIQALRDSVRRQLAK